MVALPAITGCFSTTLTSTTVAPTQSERLRSLGEEVLPVALTLAAESTGRVGFQYALFGLPVARVYAPLITSDLAHALAVSGAARGLSLTPLPQDRTASPRLEITVTDLSINGYDLFVLRRPSAYIALRGKAIAPDTLPRTCDAVGDVTHSARFAFAPELEEVLRESIDAAIQELLTCLLGERHREL
jgi:hypothetical protein